MVRLEERRAAAARDHGLGPGDHRDEERREGEREDEVEERVHQRHHTKQTTRVIRM